MEIDVKGNSGCQIKFINNWDGVFIEKSTNDPSYCARLTKQAQKQQSAYDCANELKNIKVPKIYELNNNCDTTKEARILMTYVYSKNYIDFFEHADRVDIDKFIDSMIYFIKYEISKCKISEVDSYEFIKKIEGIIDKALGNEFTCKADYIDMLYKAKGIFYNMPNINIPIGTCHGDLTFSNILFSNSNYYLIDFLDSFIETPLQDIVKLRQDSCYNWSSLMYNKRYDKIRLSIINNYIDKRITKAFSSYDWFIAGYEYMQLMNLLRIVPYVKSKEIAEFLYKNCYKLINSITIKK